MNNQDYFLCLRALAGRTPIRAPSLILFISAFYLTSIPAAWPVVFEWTERVFEAARQRNLRNLIGHVLVVLVSTPSRVCDPLRFVLGAIAFASAGDIFISVSLAAYAWFRYTALKDDLGAIFRKTARAWRAGDARVLILAAILSALTVFEAYSLISEYPFAIDK